MAEINPAEVDYTTASFQTSRYYAKSNWDSTLLWSNKAVESLQLLMETPADMEVWRNPWISQQISHAYYLLCAKHNDTSALSTIITLSKNVLEKIKLEDPFSGLKTFVYTNMAHAYYLRNQVGDRDKAYETYIAHQNTFSYQFDTWELLQKDFRDLHQAGVEWPNLRELIERIKPAAVALTQEEWREMGLE